MALAFACLGWPSGHLTLPDFPETPETQIKF